MPLGLGCTTRYVYYYISLGEAYVVRYVGLSTFCENYLNEENIRYYHLIRHIRYECGSNGHLNWQDTPTA